MDRSSDDLLPPGAENLGSGIMLKFLRVKTDTKSVIYEKVEGKYSLLGGRGLIAGLLNDEVDPTCHALGPGNKLIICGGLLTGTPAPASGRLSVGGKSPLTGTIKEANAGGIAAKMLAKLGIKAIIVENQPAENEWFILRIEKNGAELIPAEKYLGLNNYALTEQLRKEFGEKAGIISIGRAGEYGYRNSTLQVTDMDGYPARAAARGGLGAVMGSKGLKAIVLDPTGSVETEYVDKEKFSAANKNFVKAVLENPTTGQVMPTLGTASLVNICNVMGWLPTHNFSDGRWDKAENVSAERMIEIQSTRGGKQGHACHPGCVIRCSNIYNDEKGNHLTSALEYETISLNGANCGIANLDTIARIDRLCDDIGLDTMETGCTIAVCMEAGVIPFGDEAGAVRLIQEMMDGTEFGKVLGQGTEFAGKKLGVKRIPTVKGQSLAGYDPRGLKGTGVTYATSPMGADHTAGNAPARNKSKDSYDKEGKVELSTKMQVLMGLFDSLGLCIFATACTADPKNLAFLCEMMAGKFGGGQWDANRIMDLGQQTLSLERKFNQAAGFTVEDDKLPDFMYTETLPSTGTVFDITDEELRKAIPF